MLELVPRPANKHLLRPPAVLLLEGAAFPSINQPHSIYTGFPIENPAPCLTVIPQAGGHPEWRASLVTVPKDARTSIHYQTEYAPALGLIQTFGEKRIYALKTMPVLRDWGKISRKRLPFSQGSIADRRALYKNLVLDLRKNALLTPGIRTHLKQWVRGLPESSWSPIQLLRLDDLNKDLNWNILHRWDEWTKATSEITHLYHRLLDLLDEPHIEVKGNLPKEIPSQKAFKKRLSYLGLPSSLEGLLVAHGASEKEVLDALILNYITSRVPSVPQLYRKHKKEFRALCKQYILDNSTHVKRVRAEKVVSKASSDDLYCDSPDSYLSFDDGSF